MPLASVLALGLTDHDISPALRRPHFRVALTALMSFSASCLMVGPAAAAVAVLLTALTHTFTAPEQSVYALLILLAAGVMAWRARAPSPAKTVLLACALGATLLDRSPLMLFPLVLALFEWASARRAGTRPDARQLLILCLVPYLFLLPWMQMNWRAYGRVTVMERDAAEYNMVYGAKGMVRSIDADWTSLLPDRVETGTTTVFAWWLREVAAHPLTQAVAVLKRLAFALSQDPFLYPLALGGLWLRRRRRDFRELALLCGYFLLVHCLFTVHKEYFIPLRAPLSLLAAGLAARGEPKPEGDAGLFSERVLVALLAVTLLLCARAEAIAHEYGRLALLRPPGSDQALAEALEKAPDDAWLTFERGQRRLRSGRTAEAIADLEKASALRIDSPEWALQLAWARMLGGDPAPLLAWRAVPGRDVHIELRASLLRAQAYLRMGRLEAARRELADAAAFYRARVVHAQGPERPDEAALLADLRALPVSFRIYLPPFPPEDRGRLLAELARLPARTGAGRKKD